MKTRLNYYEIEEIEVCPYCESDVTGRDHWSGCCGESSSHFETRYRYEGNDELVYHPDTVELYKPIRDMIQYEILVYLRNPYLRRSKIAFYKRRLRSRLQDLYDGVTWSGNECHDSLIKRLRIVTGFQWSRLDCFILKQLHDFPLYYTPPDEVIKLRQAALAEQIKLGVSK